ncbi:sterol O-acyltransferase 2-like [Nymphalis io]|uniref:sterol O-acyltransferase 2-like n=1 Tax=Inachis io TaxID=171585 RepID=UPI002169ED24|nr:sterol O-acyltransferase 2-like [Nymphalis io]
MSLRRQKVDPDIPNRIIAPEEKTKSPEINIGVSSVVYGFGDIRRGAKLWLFELTVALVFYPGLKIYAGLRKSIREYPGLRRLLSIVGALSVIALETSLVAVPVYEQAYKHLPLASSAIVTCEMFRFVMKICAVAVACKNRLHDGSTKIPSFSHYLYFLFAPTLIYRDEYPRTKKIRWGVVVFHFIEVTAIIFFNIFLWERFILPYWSDYGKEAKVEAGFVVRNMFVCLLPGIMCFLSGFYCILHAWQNAFAEMLRFRDRLFYEDWWTSSRFSCYFRAWNLIVHNWVHVHVLSILAPRVGRALSITLIFLLSAAVHEVVLALSFGFFYPVMMIEFAVFGRLTLPLTDSGGRRFPNAFNIIAWIFLWFGNGLLWSLYSMEYFSRKNCPKSDRDSFFVPKSWSCPEIVLNPNWTFQNPFDIIY